MAGHIEHYGWLVSPYSAKTRSYLRFKGLPFDDRVPSARQLYTTIRRAVGRMIMPTVRLPDGTWLQDSSAIIDRLEAEHPEPSIHPPGPSQRLASLLIELHADEWLPIVAMHSRWNQPDNATFARTEFGRCAFPWLPGPLARRLSRGMADKMRSYLPRLGVHPETAPGIERFTRELIARLDTHFTEHAFLLGSRPALGDFALFGPLWAHVYRDPATTSLFDDSPALRAWLDRMLQSGEHRGDFLREDEVPGTLDPIFETLFQEHFAFIQALVQAIDAWCTQNPDATRVPRSLGDHPFSIGGVEGQRRLITFTQWMLQRPLDAYRALGDGDRAAVDCWLDRVGGLDAMQLEVKNRFAVHDFQVCLEGAAGPESPDDSLGAASS